MQGHSIFFFIFEIICNFLKSLLSPRCAIMSWKTLARMLRVASNQVPELTLTSNVYFHLHGRLLFSANSIDFFLSFFFFSSSSTRRVRGTSTRSESAPPSSLQFQNGQPLFRSTGRFSLFHFSYRLINMLVHEFLKKKENKKTKTETRFESVSPRLDFPNRFPHRLLLVPTARWKILLNRLTNMFTRGTCVCRNFVVGCFYPIRFLHIHARRRRSADTYSFSVV